MSDEIVFYTNPMSRGRIARWMLEETGKPYRTEILEYGTTMKAPEYLAINPMGKVPALRHGDTVITEVAAICAYLADAFPEARLAPPPDSKLRGEYYRWLFLAAGPLESAAALASLGFSEIPAEHSGFIGHPGLEGTIDIFEAAVSQRPYLLGDEFSAADLYAGSMCAFALMSGKAHTRPAIMSYANRIFDRPARRRAEELDGPMPGQN